MMGGGVVLFLLRIGGLRDEEACDSVTGIG